MSSKSRGTKSSDGARRFLSFILFGLIVISSFAVIGKQELLNTDKMISCFTSYEYVNGVRQQAIDYVDDIYIRDGLDNENVKEIISYDIIRDSIKGYMSFTLQSKRGYSQEPELAAIEQIYNELNADIKLQLDKNKISYTEDAVKSSCDKINDFIVSLVELKGSEYFKTITNVGPVVFNVAVGVSLAFTLIVALILFYTGKTRYRSIRAISISTMAAGVLDIILSVMIKIISSIKTVDLYPVYLQGAFDRFANNIILTISIAGGMLMVISVIISTAVWKIKRKDL